MKLELVEYPQQIASGNEYHVVAEATPGSFGRVTDDACYFFETGMPRRKPIGRHKTRSRRTDIYRHMHHNETGDTYTIDAKIEPWHISELTESDMTLEIMSCDRLFGIFAVGGKAAVIYYEKEGDIYYHTGEIEYLQ